MIRRGLMLLLLLPIPAGCGAAVVAESDSKSERTNEESSRVVATWHRTFPEKGSFRTVGLIDYQRGIASYTHTWKAEPPTDAEIETRDASYLRVDADFPCVAEDFGGRHWVEYEPYPPDRTPLSDVLIGPLAESAVERPADLLGLLRKASTVTRTESGVLHGDKVTAYQATLNVKRALEAMPGLRQDTRWFSDLWAAVEEQGLPLEFAVDNDGRLRKLAVTKPTWKSVTWEVEFFDYGAEFDLKPPAPDDVISADEYNRRIDERLALSGKC